MSNILRNHIETCLKGSPVVQSSEWRHPLTGCSYTLLTKQSASVFNVDIPSNSKTFKRSLA